MKHNLIFFWTLLVLFSSCTGSAAKKKVTSKVNKVVKTVVVDTLSSGLEIIPLFSECKNYDNNLSTISSGVEFSTFDSVKPLDCFHIMDIRTTDEYVFLLQMYSILQYDKKGNFIRSIGSKGRGPKEYLQLQPPLQLDRNNKLIYASDCRGDKVQVYDFEGKLKKTIPFEPLVGCVRLIKPDILLCAQDDNSRTQPNAYYMKFINDKGKELASYPSYLYPVNRKEHSGGAPDTFLWKTNGVFHSFEYGADTIFRVENTKLIPERVLTGDLKAGVDRLFFKRVSELGDKLDLCQSILRPNCGIFESDTYIIFKVYGAFGNCYMVYNKISKTFHRTFHKDVLKTSNRTIMNFFTDDIVSGLSFTPVFQSEGKAIALIPALDIIEKRDEILDFISKHASKEANKLKTIVENMKEEDNPLLMFVKFK